MEDPNNETLLHQICYESVTVEPSAVKAVGVTVEGNSYGPFFLTNSIIEVEGKDIRRFISKAKVKCVFTGYADLRLRSSRSNPNSENHKAHIDSMALWSQTNEVLEPHAVYRLKVVTKVQAQGEGPLSSYRKDWCRLNTVTFRQRSSGTNKSICAY